jgi:hypothetical protein
MGPAAREWRTHSKQWSGKILRMKEDEDRENGKRRAWG